MKSSVDLINLLDDTFKKKFGEGGDSYRTLPNGKVVICDIGYAWDFWDQFKENLDEDFYPSKYRENK